MVRPGGLGRGLGALIPAEAAAVEGEGISYREVPLDLIDVNQYQPRHHFDEEALTSLAASIAEFGVLQPVVLRPVDGTERYELIAGERRWRASKRVGLSKIPAIIRIADDQTSLVQAVVENIHRQDLNPLEEAAAYRQLLEDFGVTHEELAERLGKGRTTITNTLRLLHLPVEVSRPLVEGRLSAGHARALLNCPDRKLQASLVRQIVNDGLSVRAVEDAVRRAQADGEDQPSSRGAPGEARPAALLELEGLLSECLSTTVKVNMGSKRGKITIDFATLDDLERIYRVIQN